MLNSFSAWFAQPFDSQGSVWRWALFIGLLLVLIIAWTRILNLIADTTAAVL